MRSSSTSCPHSKPLNFGIPQTLPDEKLAFVEHVLGVLIDSRYGPGSPYNRIGKATVTTGHSQMFANVRLLTAAEVGARLELPLALANGLCMKNVLGFSPTSIWARGGEILDTLNRWLKPTAIQKTQNDSTPLARGSPTHPARSSPTYSGLETLTRHYLGLTPKALC